MERPWNIQQTANGALLNIHGTSKKLPMGHYGTSMERPTRTCQWDILASSINNTHPAQYIHCISQFYSRGPALPEQSHISTVYSRGPALPDQSYIHSI